MNFNIRSTFMSINFHRIQIFMNLWVFSSMKITKFCSVKVCRENINPQNHNFPNHEILNPQNYSYSTYFNSVRKDNHYHDNYNHYEQVVVYMWKRTSQDYPSK